MDEKEMNAKIQKHREAAESGDAAAQYEVATAYLDGPGEPEQLEEAVKWLHKAAEQGNADAMHRLYACYYVGTGVIEDAKEAIKWLRKAAEQGHAEAQISLGACYYNGMGVPQNETEALKWLRKAADQKDESAINLLKQVTDGSAKAEREKIMATKSILDEFGNAAEQGLDEVYFQLGMRYLMWSIWEFPHPLRDNTEGIKWLRKAAEQEHAEAQCILGELYRFGTKGGVPKDAVEAVKWIRKSAEQEYAEAQFRLGRCYFRSEGVEQDAATATDWYRKAAEQDYRTAQYELGKCYVEGTGVPQDDAEAAKWLQKVADNTSDSMRRRAKELLAEIEERHKDKEE
jgi:TPR repeat protein